MIDLPDDIRYAAVFLTQEGEFLARSQSEISKTGVIPQATAFLLNFPMNPEVKDEGYTYLVTAKHCLIEASVKTDPLQVRLNLRKGGFVDKELPKRDNWFEHDRSDVAIVPFEPPDDSMFMPIHADLVMTEDEQMHPKEGSEVAFVSLFSQHSGSRGSLPIVRTGTIALRPPKRLKLV